MRQIRSIQKVNCVSRFATLLQIVRTTQRVIINHATRSIMHGLTGSADRRIIIALVIVQARPVSEMKKIENY